MTRRRKLLWAAAVVALVGLLGVGALWRLLAKGGLAPVAVLVAGPRTAGALDVAEVIYDGKLGPGWDDWGWGPHKLGEGPAQVVFANFGGILLHHAQLPASYGGLAFRIKSPPDWAEFLHVSLGSAAVPSDSFPQVVVETKHVAPLADGWREVLIDWKELNPAGLPFDRAMIGSRGQVGEDWVLLDKIVLTRATGGSSQGVPAEQKLRVLCNGKTHVISEWIYGASSRTAANGASLQRLGGNPLSRFNWAGGFWNTGSDWFFENQKQDHTMFERLARLPKGESLAVVVPMLGWVAKDGSSVGFPRSAHGPQRKHDPYKAEAGDGFDPSGKPLAPRSPEGSSIAAPPELIEEWVKRVVAQDATRGERSVSLYILDNEPSLWDVTHRDVRPEPLGYDELLDRTIKYGSAIRRADPAAVIAGPAEWGWLAYQYSAVDRAAGYAAQPDRKAHGGTPLVPWYLKKLAEHHKATGERVLDVLDLHFYPAAERIFADDAATDAQAAELRLRSTRALWDPTYQDESWIKESIGLIPRMKDWVKHNYPGLRLAIGEWNFGAERHISGGLATAEALGRFGQQGLDAAFHWGELKEGTPAFWAFRAFRNFDAAGGRFQEFALPVEEGKTVSLFASRDAERKRLVLVLINRSPTTAVQTAVELDGCSDVATSRLFSYHEELKGLSAGAVQSSGRRVTTTLPPFSISVVDLGLSARN